MLSEVLETAPEVGEFVGRTSEGKSIQLIELDQKAPEEQDAQYQQNRDDDYLNQGHDRFLDT